MTAAAAVTKVNGRGKERRKAAAATYRPIATLTKQSLAYLSVSGIQSETSYIQGEWPLFVLKELSDNAFDFLNDYYPNHSKQDRKITIFAWMDPIPGINTDTKMMLRVAVGNSNVDNIQPIFENISDVFNYNFWASTKRHQHRETCGSLGDGLKRILGMGYASWTEDDNSDSSFENKQWDEPLILRFNNLEYRIKLLVDDTKIEVEIPPPTKCNAPNFTEVQIALPVSTKPVYAGANMVEYWINGNLKPYYSQYRIAKRQTEFSFVNSHPPTTSPNSSSDVVATATASKEEVVIVGRK